MPNSVKAIPDGYHAITPYLTIKGASKAIEFYKNIFHAVERMRLSGPDGNLAHAELQIGDSVIMLGDESPQMGNKSPKAIGGTPVGLCLYVKDVDAVVKAALDAGATIQQPVQDQFYGDRSGTLQDPFGHIWTIATHIEDVAPAEMQKRMEKMYAKV